MPKIKSFGRLGVYIHAAPSEHPPPHFHIVGPDTDVVVRIETLEIVEGQYRPKEIAAILAWAGEETDLLLEKWSEYNERD